MPEVELVARYRYQITDDLDERERSYGETDLELCMAIDREQADLILESGLAEGEVAISIEEVTDESA